MFNVVAGGSKRRVWSPTTIAVSVGAHIVVLAGAVSAATTSAPPPGVRADTTIVWDRDKQPPRPPETAQPQPPARPDRAPSRPVPGETLQLTVVETVPATIPDPDPLEAKVSARDYSGLGRVGTVIGPRTQNPPPGPPADPPGGEGPPSSACQDPAETPPVLNDPNLRRVLERNYPATLRSSRIEGQVEVRLNVDERGRVLAGSGVIVSASHPAFGEATLRAVERMRFRPATFCGQPVPVQVTIPILWTLAR